MRKTLQYAVALLTLGTAAVALKSGALSAQDLVSCCSASTQCQTFTDVGCEDGEDCQGTGPQECCTESEVWCKKKPI